MAPVANTANTPDESQEMQRSVHHLRLGQSERGGHTRRVAGCQLDSVAVAEWEFAAAAAASSVHFNAMVDRSP